MHTVEITQQSQHGVTCNRWLSIRVDMMYVIYRKQHIGKDTEMPGCARSMMCSHWLTGRSADFRNAMQTGKDRRVQSQHRARAQWLTPTQIRYSQTSWPFVPRAQANHSNDGLNSWCPRAWQLHCPQLCTPHHCFHTASYFSSMKRSHRRA